MKRTGCLHRYALALLACLLVLPVSAEDKPDAVRLWPEAMAERKATITVHMPEKPNGTAVVICPGGGYGMRVMGGEGHGIARWLNEHGITGIVLAYDLPRGRPLVPLGDAQRAIRTARINAKAWGIDPQRIGIIGFSAGGHLAATAGTHYDIGEPDADDPIDRVSCRPDFMILIYPVITMGEKTHRGSRRNLLGKKPTAEAIEIYSNEKQVTEDTPPAYLAHAQDDRVVVPDNSAMFHEAMHKHGNTSTYLKLPRGGHGLNGYKGPMWDAWQSGSLVWLKELKMLGGQED